MVRSVSTVPVIVATARDDESEMVRMLDAGADDYVTKPFSAAQLDARIRAVLRRRRQRRRTSGDATRGRRARRRPRPPHRHPGRRGPGALPPGVRPALLPRPAVARRSSRAGSCSPRCGASPTAAPTRPSTCTCRGCAASSARRPREPRYLHTVRGVGIKLEQPGAERRPAMRRRLFLVTLAVTTLARRRLRLPARRCSSGRWPATERSPTPRGDQAALAPVLVVDRTPERLSGALASTPSGPGGRFAVLLPDGTQVGDDGRSIPTGCSWPVNSVPSPKPAEGGIDVFSPVVVTGRHDTGSSSCACSCRTPSSPTACRRRGSSSPSSPWSSWSRRCSPRTAWRAASPGRPPSWPRRAEPSPGATPTPGRRGGAAGDRRRGRGHQPPGRPHRRAPRRRARARRRSLPPTPHAAHRAAPGRRGPRCRCARGRRRSPRGGGERSHPHRTPAPPRGGRRAVRPGRGGARPGRLLGCAGR